MRTRLACRDTLLNEVSSESEEIHGWLLFSSEKLQMRGRGGLALREKKGRIKVKIFPDCNTGKMLSFVPCKTQTAFVFLL